jgi:hypothetical protein
VQPTPLQEIKRLFGDDVDKVDVPGMEIDTISKYGINILLDFKPEDSPMRPEAAAIFRKINRQLELVYLRHRLSKAIRDGFRFRQHLADSLPSKSCLPIGLPHRRPDAVHAPFHGQSAHELQADSDILEYICAENEKDNSHIKN